LQNINKHQRYFQARNQKNKFLIDASKPFFSGGK